MSRLFVGVEQDEPSNNIFAVYADDIDEARELIIDQFADKEKYSDNFREYVTDKHWGSGLSGHFWLVDGECCFNCRVDTDDRYARHVYKKYADDLDGIDLLVYKEFESNVFQFFDENTYAETYLDYLSGDIEANSLSDAFYKIVCKKIVSNGDWTTIIIKEMGI